MNYVGNIAIGLQLYNDIRSLSYLPIKLKNVFFFFKKKNDADIILGYSFLKNNV